MVRKCRKCNKEFTMLTLAQKYCSPDCASMLKEKKCRRCGKDFVAVNYPNVFCSPECYRTNMSEKRRGKGNPYYKDGNSVRYGHPTRSLYTAAHFGACRKYRQHFMETHTYAFCEVCGKNEMATPKFEVHHLYFASLWPKHPELHNFRNLIHVCVQCHNNFHAGKRYEAEFKKLEKERGLKELFGSPNKKYPRSNLLPTLKVENV